MERRKQSRGRARPALPQSIRQALFVLGEATEAGFKLSVPGPGLLEVTGPPGVDPALCEPLVGAIRQHGAEIKRLVRWFEEERAAGRHYNIPAAARARQ